jgi:PAS domain S-box-containing protein
VIFGLSSGNSPARPVPVPAQEQADEQLRLIREVSGSGRGQRVETLFHIQNQEFWFNIQYIPIKDDQRDTDLILGIARDITDRKSLERQLISKSSPR